MLDKAGGKRSNLKGLLSPSTPPALGSDVLFVFIFPFLKLITPRYRSSSCVFLFCNSVQEEEKRLREGTRKEAVFKVLRESGSEGRTVLQIADEARQRGIRDFADSERKLLQLV